MMAPLVCGFIAFAQFAMLNVITGVFVERALEEDAEEKDATMVGRLMDFLSGSEHPGYLTWEEFEERLEEPAMQLYFKSVDLDPCEAKGLFVLLDADQSGRVEAEEFIMGCLRLRGTAKAIDLATLMYENRRWYKRIEGKLTKLTSMQTVAAKTKSKAVAAGAFLASAKPTRQQSLKDVMGSPKAQAQAPSDVPLPPTVPADVPLPPDTAPQPGQPNSSLRSRAVTFQTDEETTGSTSQNSGPPAPGCLS